MFQTFIDKLRSQPSQSKARLLAGVVLVVALILGTLWVNSVKSNLKDLNTDDLRQEGSVLSATNYIAVELMEKKNGKTYIYFKAENNTSDILNFPEKDQINLSIGEETLTPEQVLNRQNLPFVRKILTKTVNYGVLVFPELTENEGQLTIDDMYFEQTPQNIFKETMELNFEDIKPVEELRS